MPKTAIPTVQDLIEAYVAAETLPDFLPPEEIERIRLQRRSDALAAIQQIKDSATPAWDTSTAGQA